MLIIKKSEETVWEWGCICECVVYMYRGGLGSQMTRNERKEWVVRIQPSLWAITLEIWLIRSGEQQFFRCGLVYYSNVSTPSGFPVGWLTSQHLPSLLGSRSLAPSTYWMILLKSSIDISKSTPWTKYPDQPCLQYLKYCSLKNTHLEKTLISLWQNTCGKITKVYYSVRLDKWQVSKEPTTQYGSCAPPQGQK